MEICVEHFLGTCPGKDHCHKEHVYATYQWYTASSEEASNWSPCEQPLNDKLEKLYCDVTIIAPNLKREGTSSVSIDFNNMVLSSGVHLTRISTPSYASLDVTPFHTTWHWYWQSNRRMWLDFETRDEFQKSSLTMRQVEMAYQKDQYGIARFSNGRFQYTLDFFHMQQKNLETYTRRPVLRRPVYKPPPQQSICTPYLLGSCTDDKCPSRHTSKPYEWEILSNEEHWVSIQDENISKKIEEMYSDPNCNSVLSDYGDVSNVTVDFERGRLSTGQKLRRISTPTSAVPNATKHHTTWQWYWKSNQGKWLCFGEEDEFGRASIGSTEIERAHFQGKSNKLKFRNSRYQYTLCFATMTQRNEETGVVRDIIRRPKTYQMDTVTEDRSICIEYLLKKCNKGKDCPNIHSDLPYQWMIHSSKGERRWTVLSQRENHQFERFYGDVYQNAFPVRVQNRLVTVDFDKMMTLDGDHIKRVSTPSSVKKSDKSTARENESTPYGAEPETLSNDNTLASCTQSENTAADGTKWEWFYMDENNRWISFDTVCSLCQHNPIDIASDDIEKVYLGSTANKQLTFTHHMVQYTVDLNKMIQTNQQTSKSTPIKRRPVSFVSGMHAKSRNICISFFEGLCTLESSCPSMHCLQPYQWCYKTQGASTWSIFVKSVNEQLEHNYCDPSVDKTSITMPCGSHGTVCFKTMTLEYRNHAMDLTRGSTDSSDSDATNDKATITEHHTVWVWYCQDDDEHWRPLQDKCTALGLNIKPKEIELAYMEDPNGTMELEYGDKQEVIDFENFELKNTSTANKVQHRGNIRRRPKLNAAISFPTSWGIDTNYETYRLVELEPENGTEYQEIADRFSETCNKKIEKIERVQNPTLWKAYSRRKKQMLVVSGGTQIAEKQLFHGTKCYDPILEQGFDFRLAGTSNGAMYGKGSYFARDASYSEQYSKESAKMLVCRVLVGKHVQGGENIVRPPPLNHDKPNGPFYDSTVGMDRNDKPHIFVVFHFDQAYPEYLITYKRPQLLHPFPRPQHPLPLKPSTNPQNNSSSCVIA